MKRKSKEMKQEIKQRIEQINNGIVPEGYKKTKLGVIPYGWEVCHLNYLFSRLTRKNKENNNNVLTISAQKGLISQTEFFNKDIASDDKSNYYLLQKGDFAYNKSYSSGYPYGAIKELSLYDKGIVSPLYICMQKTRNNKCPSFYLQYFEAGMLNREIKAFAQEGARNHGLLNIAIGDFFNSNVILPPIAEQEKIAEILATQDRIIELKQKQFEEKEKQKKYSEQLFFDEKKKEWKWVKANELFGNVSKKNNSTSANVLSATQDYGVIPRREIGIEIKFNEENIIGYKVVDAGDFIISLRSFQGGIEYSNYQGVVSPAYTVIRNKTEICKDFYKHYFKTRDYIEHLKIATYGIRDGKQISYSDFSSIKIPYPPIKEQKKIANVLNYQKKEIDLLKQDLEQEKQKKKALMQLLLTGIVRVK